MIQEINLLLELDEYQEWIFSVVPKKNINETFKKIRAKFNEEDILEECDKCSEKLQINLYYSDESGVQYDENGDEISHWEPECIIQRQDSFQIKEEPPMDLEVDFPGFPEDEEYGDTSSVLPSLSMMDASLDDLDEETIKNMTIPKSDDKNDPKPFKCPKCNLGFVAQKNVKRHLKNKSCKFPIDTTAQNAKKESQNQSNYHDDVEMITSDPLNDTATTYDDDSLRQLQIPKSTEEDDPKPYKCPKCKIGFVAQKNVRRHLKNNSCRYSEGEIQQGLRPYMCPNCSMRFATRSNTRKHILRNACGALTSNKGLEPIMADGEDSKPFKCPDCDVGFMCRNTMLRHINNSLCTKARISSVSATPKKEKRAIDIIKSYLPENLILPDLATIKAPYHQGFQQPDGSIAYVSYSNKHGEMRVTNFDPNDLQCELCEKELRSTSDLIAHRKNTHFFPNNQPECGGCGKILEQTNEKRYHSFYCTEKFNILMEKEEDQSEMEII